MPLLGKLLLFFNLFAAAGLIYAATLDWAQRQEITATALQYYLALDGLPVDAPEGTDPEAVPFPITTSGGNVTETVRESLVKEYLKGSLGNEQFGVKLADSPVTTQLAEVKRIKEKYDAILRAADESTRLQMLCGVFSGPQLSQFAPGVLVLMAESFEEREFLRQLAKAAPQNLASSAQQAEAILNRKFESVLAQPNPRSATDYAEKLQAATEKLRSAATDRRQAGAAPNPASQTALDEALKEFGEVLVSGQIPAASRDETDRARRLAHLLVFLDRGFNWQSRVVRVVGLRQYKKVVFDQTARLHEMAQGIQRQIESDQAGFVTRYEQLKTLALQRAELAQAQEVIRKGLAGQAARDSDAVNARKAELGRQQEVLIGVKTEVNGKLATQAELEQLLFDVQKQVGEAQRENFRLEDELEKKEERALSDKGKP